MEKNYYTQAEYNYIKKGKGIIVFDSCDTLIFSTKAEIRLKENLFLNGRRMIQERPCVLRMDEDSKLWVNGQFKFMYGGDIRLHPGAQLILGDKSYINFNSVISCREKIEIGDNCAISWNFTVIDSDWHTIDGKERTEPVKIGNHVWIGTNVTILRGVEIGDNAVIAAGAVVTKSIPAGCMAGGVPAKVIRRNVVWE